MRGIPEFDPAEVDLALFGAWPGGREGEPWPAEQAERVSARVVLEMKSLEAVSPVEELAGLLNELTAEMGEQFRLFRRLRADAEPGLAGEGEADGADGFGPDGRRTDGARPDGKTARADVKAATDAMSLIVRTLEKIDALQRQLARDRADAEARRAEEDDDAAIHDRLEALIAARADERARILFDSWKNGGGACLDGAFIGDAPMGGATGPPGEPRPAPGAGGG
ncbi:hypothetical protein M8R20_15120 [Pseudomonas sp. R2.Fl]|nr:hypothetical protein [Pseudomonas sp. R2.Fl]